MKPLPWPTRPSMIWPQPLSLIALPELCPSLELLQPPYWSHNTLSLLLPPGLCTYCSLCLKCSSLMLFFFFKDFIYVLKRGQGREKETSMWKRNRWAFIRTPTGDWASNPRMCPDQESKWWPFALRNNNRDTPVRALNALSFDICRAFFLLQSHLVKYYHFVKYWLTHHSQPIPLLTLVFIILVNIPYTLFICNIHLTIKK